VIASLRILTIGTTPLSLSAGKLHLRVDHSDDDNAITDILKAAFDMVERKTGRAYREQTATLFLDGFPNGAEPMVLPRPPLQSVTSITYTDAAGNNQTLASNQYEVITSAVPGEIIPVNGVVWPVALNRRGSVRITFAAGNAAACPDTILNAVRLQIDHDYHEHSPLESLRIDERVAALIRGHCLRNPHLVGITT
jgi:uncharacterized phiE125 gp8 family phage protein